MWEIKPRSQHSSQHRILLWAIKLHVIKRTHKNFTAETNSQTCIVKLCCAAARCRNSARIQSEVMPLLQVKLDKNSVSSCVCLHGSNQWRTGSLTASCQRSRLYNVSRKKTHTHLSISSLVLWQYHVGDAEVDAFLLIIFNRAQGTVGHVLNHSCCGRWRDREILFSVYLGIYCSTECNITIQKQDPNYTDPAIHPFPLSFFSVSHSLFSPSKLHYITTNRKKAPFF